MTPGDPQMRKGTSRVSKSEPKGIERESKGNQKEANGTKMEPKGDDFALSNRSLEKTGHEKCHHCPFIPIPL